MPTDRFVYWKTEERPTLDQVREVCEDFVGEVGNVRWEPKIARIIIALPGLCSEPLRRSGRITDAAAHRFDDKRQPFKRWIEVFVHDDPDHEVDVITRHADPFTDALADRLAEEFVRGWDGTVNQEESFRR